MNTPLHSPAARAALLGLALGLASIYWLATGPARAQGAQPAASPKPSMTVTTARPSRASLPLTLSANGNIAAWQEASVGAEVSGLRLADVLVAVGDGVRRGQPLAVFASEGVLADVAQAKATVAEASAQAAEASGNAERARTLLGTGALSQQQINQLLTADLTAQARLESARAALTQQQLRLQHTQVLAPDSGTISARSATVGAVVGAGTELFRLIRQGRLEWRAEVTSAELGRLRAGSAVRITTAGDASVDGRVRMVGPTVDPQTRTALVYVDLAPGAAALGVKPGMFARGEFVLGSSAGLTVPQQAVVVRDGFHYVFSVDANRKVSMRKVALGRRFGDMVEVVQGLDAEATIAVAGAGFLGDGDTVRISNAAEPVPKPAPAPAKPSPSASK